MNARLKDVGLATLLFFLLSIPAGLPAAHAQTTAPQFVSTGAADAWLKGDEPVILLEHNGQARAYPLQIMGWHEIVNDQLGDALPPPIFSPSYLPTAAPALSAARPSTWHKRWDPRAVHR